MCKKIFKYIDNVELVICGTMLFSIIGLQFIQVIARFGFGRSIGWAEELSRFALLALVYISAAIGARYNTHIRVSAHLKRFPFCIRIACATLSSLIWLAFNIVVIYYCVEYINMMARRPQISGALLIDLRWIFALIPLGFALQSIRIIQLWIIMIKNNDFTPLFNAGDE